MYRLLTTSDNPPPPPRTYTNDSFGSILNVHALGIIMMTVAKRMIFSQQQPCTIIVKLYFSVTIQAYLSKGNFFYVGMKGVQNPNLSGVTLKIVCFSFFF